MAQRIIDLDAVVPENVAVRIDGETYELPPDIPIPDYLAIARTIEALDSARPEDAVNQMGDIYERVLDLFRINSPEIEDLPIGPRRLGELILQIYGEGGEEEKPARPTPRRNGTRSSSPRPRRKSGSSK